MTDPASQLSPLDEPRLASAPADASPAALLAAAGLPQGLRVALVHDWLVTLRGGERVLDAFCALFPQATLFTLVREPGVATPRIEAMHHVSSFANRVPLATRKHRWLLPLYPTAIEQLDLSDYDLVLSSSHCVAKGVIPAPGAVHVCYCHTPVRYAWDRTDDYIAGSHPALRAARPALQLAARWLRQWDLATLGRVDAVVANSHNTASKIQQFWHRDATVVAPPVDAGQFLTAPRWQGALPAPLSHLTGPYDLVLGGLVPYKRVDLAVQAYSLMPERTLVVVGDGPERERVQRLAPPNVHFAGRAAEADLARWYSGASMLVFPGEEDFGIVPLEAQAAGTPVVAFGKGGALESVRGALVGQPALASQTGVFFDQPTAAALAQAVRHCAALGLSADVCRAHAAAFDRPQFLAQMANALGAAWQARNHSLPVARARLGAAA